METAEIKNGRLAMIAITVPISRRGGGNYEDTRSLEHGFLFEGF
jgi:hypothetical protein